MSSLVLKDELRTDVCFEHIREHVEQLLQERIACAFNERRILRLNEINSFHERVSFNVNGV